MNETVRVEYDLSQPISQLQGLTGGHKALNKVLTEYDAWLEKNSKGHRTYARVIETTEQGTKKLLTTVLKNVDAERVLVAQFETSGAVTRKLNVEVINRTGSLKTQIQQVHFLTLAEKELQRVQTSRLGITSSQPLSQAARTEFGLESLPVTSNFIPTSEPKEIASNLKAAQLGLATYTNQAVVTDAVATNKIMSQAQQRAQAVESANDRITLSWKSIVRIIEAQILFRLIATAVQDIHEGIKTAEEFSIRVAEIQTISQRAGVSNEDLAHQIRNISAEFGAPVLQVAEGYYQAISNQIVTAANSTAFMREEMKLAMTTVATLDQAVNTTTSLLNAYGLQSSDAARINAILFKGVDLGRFRLEDLSNTLGRTSVAAKQLGISIEEQIAALTLMTRMGIEPGRALTYLANVETHLAKPSKELNKLWQELSVTSSTNAIQVFGFAGVMEILAKKIETSGDRFGEITKLMNDMRASMGAATMVGMFKEYSSDLQALSNADEQYAKASQIMMESAGQKMKIEMNKVKLYFMEDLGRGVLETAIRLSKTFGGLDEAVKLLVQQGAILVETFIAWKLATSFLVPLHTALSASIATTTIKTELMSEKIAVCTATTKAATVATTAFKWAWASFGPQVVIFATIEAISYLMAAEDRAREQLEKNQEKFEKKSAEQLDITLKAQSKQSEEFKKYLKENLQGFYQYSTTLQKEITNGLEYWQNAEKSNAKVISTIHTGIIKEITGGLHKLQDEIKRAEHDSKKLEDEIRKNAETGEKRKFELGIKDKTDIEKVKALTQRYDDKMVLAATLTAQGKLPEADEVKKEADRVFEELERIDQKTETELKKHEEIQTKTVERHTKERNRHRLLEGQSYLEAVRARQRILSETKVQRTKRALSKSKSKTQKLSTLLQPEIQLQNRQERDALKEGFQQENDLEKQQTITAEAEKQRAIHKEITASYDLRILKEKDLAKIQSDTIKKLQVEAETKKNQVKVEEVQMNRLKMQFADIDQFKLTDKTKASDFADKLTKIEETAKDAGITDPKMLNQLLGQYNLQFKILKQRERENELGKQQKDIVNDLAKAIEGVTQAEEKLKTAQGNLSETQTNDLNLWNKTMNQINAWTKDSSMAKFLAKNSSIKTDPMRVLWKQIKDKQEELKFANDKVTNEPNEGNLKARIVTFRKMISLMNEFQAKYEDGRVLEFLDKNAPEGFLYGNELSGTIEKLSADFDAKLKKVKEGLDALGEKNELKKIIEFYQDRLPEAYRFSTQKAQEAENSKITAIDATIKKLDEYVAKVKKAGIIQNNLNKERIINPFDPTDVQNQATGGPVRGFARGGPSGTDTIPAWLSPGEYVWNARTTRQYYPLINALNNSSNSNTTVGDININVRGGDTSQMTVRNIGNALRREIRRGTVRLN